jgi:hypothetical protein
MKPVRSRGGVHEKAGRRFRNTQSKRLRQKLKNRSDCSLSLGARTSVTRSCIGCWVRIQPRGTGVNDNQPCHLSTRVCCFAARLILTPERRVCAGRCHYGCRCRGLREASHDSICKNNQAPQDLGHEPRSSSVRRSPTPNSRSQHRASSQLRLRRALANPAQL